MLSFCECHSVATTNIPRHFLPDRSSRKPEESLQRSCLRSAATAAYSLRTLQEAGLCIATSSRRWRHEPLQRAAKGIARFTQCRL